MASETQPTAPFLVCLPNGPYYLILDTTPQPIPYLRNAQGEPCATGRGVALCRCGASQNKPFCDGTHGRIGFQDRRETSGANDRRASYPGKRLVIHDNRGICAHAGVCTDNLPGVFRMGTEPWIDPDGAEAEAVMDVIRRCPSGALSYTLEGDEYAGEEREPTVVATRKGPYAVTGGIPLASVEFGEGASREHYTLCRCGASRNKPFCDGSHWEVGFSDGSE
jgi:CDGSH-type Zn-finger protein